MRINRLSSNNTNQHRNNTINPFYQSKDYKKWRSEVMQQSNYLCVHCLDPTVRNQDGTTGRKVKPGKVTDHIIPIKAGGAPLDPANGQYLCKFHDSVKSIKDKQYYK